MLVLTNIKFGYSPLAIAIRNENIKAMEMLLFKYNANTRDPKIKQAFNTPALAYLLYLDIMGPRLGYFC